MAPNLLFKIINSLVLPAWILLIFFPKKKVTENLIYSGAISFGLSFIYAICLITNFKIGSVGGFDSLESVRLLFSKDWALLAGWIHYLAFDLYIGAKIIEKRNDNLPLRFIIAFLTFMFGPVGFFLSKIIPEKSSEI